MNRRASSVAARRARRLGALLAGGLPMLLWIGTVSAFPSGAPGAQAAALWLEPQHPLWTLWAKPLVWLPLGPLALRVALASALALSLAAAVLYLALCRTLARGLRIDAPSAALLSLGASWTLSGLPPASALGNSAQPAALAVLLGSLAIERWSAFYLGPAGRGRLVSCLLLALLCAAAEPWLGAVAMLPALAARHARRLPSAPHPAAASNASGRRLRWALALAAVALGLVSLRHAALARLELAHAPADALDQELRGASPARALLLVRRDTALRLADAEREQRSRPDLRWLPLDDLEQAQRARQLIEELPQLAPLLRDWLLQGELPVVSLQSLAGQRPLLLELEPDRVRQARPELIELLEPFGLLLRASSSPLIPSDLTLAARRQGEHRATGTVVHGAPLTLQAWVAQRREAEILLYRRAAPEQAARLIEAAALATPAPGQP